MRVSRRLAIAVLAAAALAGVAIGIGVHAITGGGSRPAAHGQAGLRGEAIWPPGLRRAPGFSLQDQTGGSFSLASTRGKPVILAFMDSRCHEVCPLEGRVLAAGLRNVPTADRPAVVVVSVDPWADTPGSARRAIRRFGLAPYDWHWLLGPAGRLKPVWRKFRIEVRRGAHDIEHTDAVYLIDARGFERAGMVYPFLPTWISDDLSALARESSG